VTGSADRDHWSRAAGEWIAWARAPGHDAFWSYRSALRAFLGEGRGAAIDVGCGEGRVSRLLRECGYRVTAVDPVAALVDAARAESSADAYAVAPAAALPFADASFHLAVAYNVLMDVEEVPAALGEIARVLRPDGTLMVSIVHPFSDRGRFEGEEPDARFVVDGSYFGRERFDGAEERGGLRMSFAGWSQPLEAYAAAITGAGLAITALAEPVPDLDHPGVGREHLRRWTRLPLFLWLKARSW
jgi:SAM-dependent methyltransferase